MWQTSRIILIVSVVSTLNVYATVGNVLLMSKDDMHLQKEQFSNIIRTVRSKVGQPKVFELWEGTVGNNGDYSTDLNRIRRSIVEIQENDKLIDGRRKTKSLNQQVPDDIPVNDLLQEPRQFNDQIHVVSSAIRVLSKKDEHGREGGEQIRLKRNEWRNPRTQFVTRTERMSPLGPRYQFPPERSDRYLLDNEITPGYRRTSLPQRRIIYYATLPEIVRRPPVNNEWPQQQQQLQYTSPLPSRQQPVALESRPYYPLMRDNEVTRVQSSVIDVTNRDPPASPSQTPTIISSVLASPKYTIIDAEPPYVRPYYNNYPYNVRYPQPYYNYNSNNRYYYDDIRTPPYRIQQTFQPPYYNKPEYVPVELPTASPTAPSGPSSSQESIVDSNLQQISTTNSTIKASDKTDKHSDNSNLNSINSRYI